MTLQTILTWLQSYIQTPVGMLALSTIGVWALNKFPTLSPIATLLRNLFDQLIPPSTTTTVTIAPSQALQTFATAMKESGMQPEQLKTALTPFVTHVVNNGIPV